LFYDSRVAFAEGPVQVQRVAGAWVGKASRCFSSLKAVFRRHGVAPDAQDGAFTARLTLGPGSADAMKQRRSLISALSGNTQHHAARPQELAHSGRGNGNCRGEQPSRLSRPAFCRVPEPWKLKAPVLVTLQWVSAKAPRHRHRVGHPAGQARRLFSPHTAAPVCQWKTPGSPVRCAPAGPAWPMPVFYEVKAATTGENPDPSIWDTLPTVPSTQAQMVFSDYPVGSWISVRMRAIGAKGPSPWSEAAVIRSN